MVNDHRSEASHDRPSDRPSERMDFRPPHGEARSLLNAEATDLRRAAATHGRPSGAENSRSTGAENSASRRNDPGDSLTIPSINEVIGGGSNPRTADGGNGSRTTDGGSTRTTDSGNNRTTDGGTNQRTTDRGTNSRTTDGGTDSRTTGGRTIDRTADGFERTIDDGTVSRTAGNGMNLDTSKSIDQLIKDGVLVQDELAKRPEEVGVRTEKLKEGDKPTIEVRFADPKSDNDPNKSKADFIIGLDGTTEVLNNPELSKDGHIVIELQRPSDPTAGPTKEQQEAVDQLTAYLFDRLPKSVDGITKDNLTIDDKQGLVSPELKNALNPDLPKNDIPPETQQQIERMNRLPSQGSMPSSDAGQYFPERDVPRQLNETDKIAADKDTIAALFNPDKDAPYETVREPRGDRGYRVGRYGFSYDLFADWLNGLLDGEEIDFTDPASMAKAMQKLAAKGKVPKDFAAKFNDPAYAKRFGQFMQKMKTGEGKISKAEVKEFLPKELQETIGTDLVSKYNKSTGNEIGKVAVAFHEGKPPKQLTGEDYNNPANQTIAKAAREYEKLAEARQQAGPNQDIGFARGPTSELEFKILDAAKSDVGKAMWKQSPYSSWTQNGRLGCAASVSEVLQQVGFDYANSAGVGVLTDQLKAKGWAQVPLSEAHAGDVVYGSEPGTNLHAGGGNAHVGIVGENGKVYHNSSSQGAWVEGSLEGVFNTQRFGNQRYALRPPDLSNA